MNYEVKVIIGISNISFISCSTADGGYFYAKSPSGTIIGKVDIPNNNCRTDTISKSYFNEAGIYTAIIADYNNIEKATMQFDPSVYTDGDYFSTIKVDGGGSVEIFKNGASQGIVNGGQIKNFNYVCGDKFKYIATPKIGESLTNVCSTLDAGNCWTDLVYENVISTCGFSLADTLVFSFTGSSIQPICSSLVIDTWRPSKIKANTGEAIPFTIRSKNPNTAFVLRSMGLINTVLVSGVTDNTGCYEGTLPAQPEGTYTISVCYTTLGFCIAYSNDNLSPILITWAQAPSSIECSNIPVDTWRPSKVKANSGEAVPFTIRSKVPNAGFILHYYNLYGYGSVVEVVKDTTDATGCFTGTIPAQPDGKYDISACFTTLGLCILSNFGTTSIEWTSCPPDPIGNFFCNLYDMLPDPLHLKPPNPLKVI